jgi:hypothetical protein
MLIGKGNGDWECFVHDALHRVTDGEAAGNDPGICFRFRYDNTLGVLGSIPTGVSISNTMGRVAEAETDTCASPITQASMITDEWFSYDADGRLTDVYEKTPNSGGYYHTVASYWANGALNTLNGAPGLNGWTFAPDGEGRPYSATYGSSN